jgi:hypothetical protein
MNDDDTLNDCDSSEIEGRNAPEVCDEALEAAADNTKTAFSLSSIGIMPPNCC